MEPSNRIFSGHQNAQFSVLAGEEGACRATSPHPRRKLLRNDARSRYCLRSMTSRHGKGHKALSVYTSSSGHDTRATWRHGPDHICKGQTLLESPRKCSSLSLRTAGVRLNGQLPSHSGPISYKELVIPSPCLPILPARPKG